MTKGVAGAEGDVAYGSHLPVINVSIVVAVWLQLLDPLTLRDILTEVGLDMSVVSGRQ